MSIVRLHRDHVSIPQRSRILGAMAALAVLALDSGVESAPAVILNEIHYDSADKTSREEFVELFNRSEAPVDLDAWFISGGIDFEFPAGTRIEPGFYLVVAEDPERLEAVFGLLGALGPYRGSLSASGERIFLRRPDGSIEDLVEYDDEFPWPVASSGEGSSLERIHPDLDADLAGHWRASGFSGRIPSERRVFVPASSGPWRYRKGRSESSDPPAAWRMAEFVEDASWQDGVAPIGFGDPGQNTILDDMLESYTSVYFRRAFEFDPLADLPAFLRITLAVDDGAVVWVNGVEVARLRVSAGDLPFDGVGRNGEAVPTTIVLPSPGDYLRPGRNLLAIHAFNVRLSSNDFSLDAELFEPGERDFPDASAFVSPPSPGRRNTVYSELVPPRIRQVAHVPAEPRSGDAVALRARVTDPDGLASVRASFRIVEPGTYISIDEPAYEEEWNEITLLDDGVSPDDIAGDGVFAGIIAADVQVHRRLIRYRIRAIDRTGDSISAPYRDDPQPNFAYFVYDGLPAWRGSREPGRAPIVEYGPEVLGLLPVYHLIAKAIDVQRSQFESAFESRHFPGALVYDGRVYDHITFENRGEFSTYVSGKNKWRFHFQRSHEFQARDDHGRPYSTRWRTMNLSSVASPWVPTNRGMAGLDEAVAFRIYDKVGVPSSRTNYFHFRVIDEADEAHPTDQFRGDLWGLYLTIEQTDGRFLEERGLPDGNVYKIENAQGDKRNQGPTQPTSSSDFDALRSGYSRAQPIAWWRANVDLDIYYSFRAVDRVINNMDLREGWNICQYHNPATGRWEIIPWDLDMLWMPVTHWSGVMDFQNALTQHTALRIEYGNRARELQDLFVTTDQIGRLIDEVANFVNPLGVPLTMVDVDEAMWNFHPRSAGGHRGAFYRNPSTHGAIGGTITRRLASANHEGFVGWVKSFCLEEYGARQLAAHAQDNAIPDRPTIEFDGRAGFPIDAIRVQSSTFHDPQGDDTLAAIAWRLARITPPADALDARSPRDYEIRATWESGPIEGDGFEIVLPTEVMEIGARYRARVRHGDATGRWSRWSTPLEFTAEPPRETLPQVSVLRVTEIHFHPIGDDESLEFIELQNTSAFQLDLRPVRIGGGVEFRFDAGEVESLAPGAFVVVAEDRAVLEARYGQDGILVAGEYSGQLSNAGETIVVTHGPNAAIQEITYDDAWHPTADGVGYSLVTVDPLLPAESWSSAEAWRPSREPGGSPGRDDGEAPPGGLRLPSDLDGDGRLDVTDAVRLLLALFSESKPALPCSGDTIADGGNRVLADADADGSVGLSDAVRILRYIFAAGPEPALGATCIRIEGCVAACIP
jgi:hypothetical protein